MMFVAVGLLSMLIVGSAVDRINRFGYRAHEGALLVTGGILFATALIKGLSA